MLYVTIQVQQAFLYIKVADTKHFTFFNTEPGYRLWLQYDQWQAMWN